MKDSTEVLLANSMKQLVLSGIPFEKVTIKQIASGAGLIRPTFYRHFVDKYELLEWIFAHDVLEPSYALFDTKMIDEAVTIVFKRIEMDCPFYASVLRTEGQNSFRDILMHSMVDWIIKLMTAKEPVFSEKKSWLTRENVAWFYASSMSIIIAYWIQQGKNWTVEDVLQAYHYLSTHTMEETLRGAP